VIVVIYYHYAICQPDLLLQPQSFGKISQNLHLHNFPKLTFPDFPTKVCLHTLVHSFTSESLPELPMFSWMKPSNPAANIHPLQITNFVETKPKVCSKVINKSLN